MLNRDQKTLYLRDVPIFAGLALDDLAQIAEVTRELAFARGEVVFEQGAAGDALYVVLDGEVAIEVQGVEVHRCKGGKSFGEIAVLDNAPRTATARAATETFLLRLERAAFNELLEKRGRVRSVVLSELARQLLRVQQRVRTLEGPQTAE